MINLKDKIVILTGGKGQLGTVITKSFRDEGAIVYDFDYDDFDLRNKKDVYENYKFRFLTYKNSKITKPNYKIIKDLMDRSIEKN